MENIFEKLSALNVNEHIEKRSNGKMELSYLSWAWAWAEFKKAYPQATYEVIKFDGLPYAYDEKTGYMCYTRVTVDDLTHEMWLPVMDGANKAMKSEPYTYETKYGEKMVEAATMFDINKTIMRCLTKNLAMFGLGIYIYAGEDLPEENQEPSKLAKKMADKFNVSAEQIDFFDTYQDKERITKMLKYYNANSIFDLNEVQANEAIEKLRK